GLYGWLGNPAGLGPTAGPPPAAEVPDQAVEAMLDAMAQKMATQTPGSTDAAGWTLLARSYASLQRFDDASRAYAQALALAPDDAQLLVDQADVLAMRQGGRTEGEPSRLIARALRIAPDNLKALALGGTDAFEKQDFAEAGRLWSKARTLASPGAFAERMQANLDALPDSQTQTTTSAWVSGRVRLSPSLAASVRPGDTLFVFARAENGPRMPLAIARYSASVLPMEFRLDDSNAMSGALRMSGHARVVVGARVSRSGEALSRSGDVYGETGSIETGRGDVDIVIDAMVP
ncbi:MAG: tetratricopeptide repeat protein, partial [Gammaproteobacteria bacterium]|nr:tetratricopeptide repeat protein [Gammaproteobacteria bacterium]